MSALTVKGGQSLDVGSLPGGAARKPGALPGATALVQARAAGVFTPAHEAFWAAARKAHGDGAGTRALIEVLLLHRHLAAATSSPGSPARLRCPGSGGGSDLPRRIKPCLHPASTTRRPVTGR